MLLSLAFAHKFASQEKLAGTPAVVPSQDVLHLMQTQRNLSSLSLLSWLTESISLCLSSESELALAGHECMQWLNLSLGVHNSSLGLSRHPYNLCLDAGFDPA
jgi:hypothetical protein